MYRWKTSLVLVISLWPEAEVDSNLSKKKKKKKKKRNEGTKGWRRERGGREGKKERKCTERAWGRHRIEVIAKE